MTTTLQQIQDRAVAFSSANGLSSLVSDTAEMINRIAALEQAVYDLATRENRHFFALKAAIASTSAASDRSIALTGLTVPCGRILQFKLADGRIVNQVDVLDVEAELAPRYYVLGKTIYEVGNDWSASSAAISGFLTYVRQPAVLNKAGTLTQTLSLDDEFTVLLELRLAEYLAHKDVGRDPTELERLEKMIAEAEANFVSHITEFGGVEARRFNQPQQGDKK
jgi:hypothetical protein